MKYCIKCGAQMPDEATFCPKCGSIQHSASEYEAPHVDAEPVNGESVNPQSTGEAPKEQRGPQWQHPFYERNEQEKPENEPASDPRGTLLGIFSIVTSIIWPIGLGIGVTGLLTARKRSGKILSIIGVTCSAAMLIATVIWLVS
jgi:hypothetical protein